MSSQQQIVAISEPYFPLYVELIQQAFEEYSASNLEFLPGVEKARANWMFWRMQGLLQTKFGVTGSPRFLNADGLCYVLIDSPDLLVGIRYKKFNRRGLSQNHHSGRQNELQQTCLFPATCAEHVFIGCRLTHGLVPTIASISITQEHDHEIVWKHIIWSGDDGFNTTQETSPPLLPPSDELPTPARVRPKRTRKNRDVGEG